jgi:hypothetical protein
MGNSIRFPLGLSLLKVFGLRPHVYLFYFDSKNRHGTSPKMAFPHLAYVGTRGIAFLQPCARERRYFRGENCCVSPPDGLTAGTLRVFGLHGSTSRGIYRTSSVSLWTKQTKIPVSKGRDYKNYLALRQR